MAAYEMSATPAQFISLLIICHPLSVSICLAMTIKQHSEDMHEHHYLRLSLKPYFQAEWLLP
jgi:hypothetical protein